MTNAAAADLQQDDPALRAAQAARLDAVWSAPRGWRYWSEVNNDAVGQWYIVVAFCFFLFAGVLALLMRVQLAVPDNHFLNADTYNQAFTLHGSVMMFLFAVPIFEAFAVLMLPQMLGTRDMPYPRLTAYGFWCFLIGGVFVCGSILFGAAPQGGWFMYPPLATRFQEGLGADVWLLGLSFIEISSIAAAVELVVGVLRCRPPGMRLDLMPPYAWYILVVAGMILFGFPPLIAGDILFELERAFDWPFFDPARGGDPLLWQHLFWIFGHPEVYIIFLPAVALVATIVPTFAQRPIVGYNWIVLSAVGVGFLSFGLWVHHMFTTGLPDISLAFFSAASEAVAIPTAIQIFCFIATIFAGRLKGSVPMLFIAGSLAIFVIGGLTGVMIALAPLNFQVHDTYFIVAHLHYVLIGGMLFPVIAAFYYYMPLVRARWLSPRLGKLAFWIMFSGFNIAFLPMHLTGLAGMPRRVYTYAAASGFDTLNLISTIGAFLFAAGFAIFAGDVIFGRRRAPPPHNPWNAGALEWLPALPKPSYSPRSVPHINSRYPLWQQPTLRDEIEQGRHYLPDAQEGLRETLVTSTLDARPLQCLRMPGPSFIPLLTAVATGGAFIATVYSAWMWVAISGALAAALILLWIWDMPATRATAGHKHVGRGLVVPLYRSGSASTGWWGMFALMVADSTAFVSLLFGYFYYWTVHGDFVQATPVPGAIGLWMLSAVLVIAAWLALRQAHLAFGRDRRRLSLSLMVLSSLLALAAAGALLGAPRVAGLLPTRHVYDAIVWLLCGWTALHLLLGAVMPLYCLARALSGHLTPQRDSELCTARLYWHFMTGTALLTVWVVAWFPEAS